MKVAYPGREGAHSAAACALLFPDEEALALPSFSDVVAAVASGRVEGGVLPIESSISGPVAETHDLLVDSAASINAQTILPIRHFLVGVAAVPLGDQDRPLAPGRARPVPPAARLAAGGVGDRSRHDRRRRRPGGQGRRPERGGDRERARGGAARPRRARGRRGRPPRGLHAVRRDLEPDAARRGRRLADRVLVPNGPQTRRAPPGDRAVRPSRARPRPADVAPDPADALALPLRRRPQRPPLDATVCGDACGVRRQAQRFTVFGSYPA